MPPVLEDPYQERCEQVLLDALIKDVQEAVNEVTDEEFQSLHEQLIMPVAYLKKVYKSCSGDRQEFSAAIELIKALKRDFKDKVCHT